MSGTDSLELRQVVAAVSRSLPLDGAELPDEFFPAHLPVALIDAMCRSRLRPGERPAPIAERYCRRFGIARLRADRWEPPPVDEQETLGHLLRRYDELGADRIASEVFRSRHRFPGAKTTRAEGVRDAARALRGIGVDVLQDVPARRPAEIRDALRPLPGIGEHAVRMLLMYTGDEDFVLGDVHLRRFVASAIGRRTVSAARAEDLVRRSAYELNHLAPVAGPRALALRRLRRRGRPAAGASGWKVRRWAAPPGTSEPARPAASPEPRRRSPRLAGTMRAPCATRRPDTRPHRRRTRRPGNSTRSPSRPTRTANGCFARVFRAFRMRRCGPATCAPPPPRSDRGIPRGWCSWTSTTSPIRPAPSTSCPPSARSGPS